MLSRVFHGRHQIALSVQAYRGPALGVGQSAKKQKASRGDESRARFAFPAPLHFLQLAQSDSRGSNGLKAGDRAVKAAEEDWSVVIAPADRGICRLIRGSEKKNGSGCWERDKKGKRAAKIIGKTEAIVITRRSNKPREKTWDPSGPCGEASERVTHIVRPACPATAVPAQRKEAPTPFFFNDSTA
ncbi:hypothetical protein MRX96_058636 [Rhipicephalus microplus]